MSSSPTPHRFHRESWELGDAFGWVLDRDTAQFGRIFTEEDWRSASYREAMSPERKGKPKPSARSVLLQACQRGEIVARDRDGIRVDPDFWLGKAEYQLPALGRAFLFRREEVLQLWPDHIELAARAAGRGLATGAAGRPRSLAVSMIWGEFVRRRDSDECRPTLREEAEELGRWFRQRYPLAVPVSRSTVENNIRALHREWLRRRNTEMSPKI